MDMDGTKRKRDSFSLFDPGATPPHSLPASVYEESALRSTQNNANFANPSQLQETGGPQRAVATNEEVEDDGDDYKIVVDTDNDGVYMINAGEGSWSGSLPSEEDPAVQAALPYQAEIALVHLKRAQELAKQQESIAAGNAAIETMLRDKQSQRDLLLRNIIRRVKRQLKEGAELVLERMTTDTELSCAHPDCPAAGTIIPAGAYYITLQNDRNLNTNYCLFCLEGLWDGDGMIGTLDAAAIPRIDGGPQYLPSKPSPLSQTHFQIPDSLLSSKHAPSGEELSTLTMKKGNTPGSPVSTENSITSDGEWRHPPTRFQCIAKFVRGGSSLTAIEKAAVELWKLASEEQLQWEEFRNEYAQNIEELKAGSDNEGVDVLGRTESLNAVQIMQGDATTYTASGTRQKREVAIAERNGAVQDQGQEWQQEVEKVAGLSKRDCRGRNLTAVLADVRSQQSE